MRPHDSRLKWPLSGLVAAALLSLLLGAADRWLWRGPEMAPPAPRAAAPGDWLTILPPAWEPDTDPTPPAVRRVLPPAEFPEPAPWWRLAWQQRAVELAGADRASPAPPDSTALVLARLGLLPGLAERVRPDSVLAARLVWLSLREGYLPGEVRPFLKALGRAEAYRAIAAQAAALYDEFLDQQILTPD